MNEVVIVVDMLIDNMTSTQKGKSKVTRSINKIPIPAPHLIEWLVHSPCLLRLSVSISDNQLDRDDK